MRAKYDYASWLYLSKGIYNQGFEIISVFSKFQFNKKSFFEKWWQRKFITIINNTIWLTNYRKQWTKLIYSKNQLLI